MTYSRDELRNLFRSRVGFFLCLTQGEVKYVPATGVLDQGADELDQELLADRRRSMIGSLLQEFIDEQQPSPIDNCFFKRNANGGGDVKTTPHQCRPFSNINSGHPVFHPFSSAALIAGVRNPHGAFKQQ